MADDPVLGEFLGSAEFPVTWDSESEKKLLWIYDDLHCPMPLSPMYFDIGGWWLTCDHMFRRFGTPFAVDWVAKRVNGYLYTAAVPADPDLVVDATEYGSRYRARVPVDGRYAQSIPKYLDTVLPVYGEHFVQWWKDRLLPEMERNFAHLDAELARSAELGLPELAVLLEDAIDMHDRHWKIHWMLNFAQLSATLELRAVMERTRGSVDESLLGRLQNSADDRNWDSIRALWEMKEQVRADPELTGCFATGGGAEILAALQGSEAGRRFLAEQVAPYQQEFGMHAVWSHEFLYPTLSETVQPVLDLVRGYVESDYDFPAALAEVAQDLQRASEEVLDGLTGSDREEMAAANAVNLRMAPLTPDHHFYIDQGANARVRLVLMALGRHLVGTGVLTEPDDVMFLQYNELRALIGDPSVVPAGEIVAGRRAEREESLTIRPRDWIGTATESSLAFPYLVNWGYPERFHRTADTVPDQVSGIPASPGVVEGPARVVRTVEDFDEVDDGDVLVCQMTNPAWVVLFTRIAALVTDTGGTTSHPAVLAREFGIPAVVGSSVGTHEIATGDSVRVDGSTGIVTILARSSTRATAPNLTMA